MIKSCGGCQHWLKIKHREAGICQLHDYGQVKSDDSCKSWKAIPYNRNKK